MGERRAGETPERAPATAGEAPPRVKVGEYLAQQRRLRGISVDELCEITKIPRRNLERLESGAFDDQQDGFARGFVRTVALALGLDPDEAVMRLIPEPDADAEPAGGGTRWLLLRLGAVAAALLLAILLFELASALLAGRKPPPPEPELTYRRDAVSDLARERTAPAEPAASTEPGDAEAAAGSTESGDAVAAAGTEPVDVQAATKDDAEAEAARREPGASP